MALTPEQRAELDEYKKALDEAYAKKAKGFRAWINTHDALWAARHFGTVGFLVGGALVIGVLRLFGKV